ncbi:hypothetical protein [Actinoplanes sp. NPDC049599]|uniref:hypothetical protein n=1 Tax=Actinoplanes sp. NPDC049599 TaxID=3363903 RepID=UPI0037B7B155
MQPAKDTTPMPPSGGPVTVVDGTAEAQEWVDTLVAQARTGTGDWPHKHPAVPAARITLAQLHVAIEHNYFADGRPWSVERDGYPPLEPGPAGLGARPDEDPGNRGSMSHNLLHSILGDFH